MEFSIDTSKYLDNILGKLTKLNNKYNEENNFKIICRVKNKKVNNGYLEMAEKNLLNNRLDKLNKVRKKNKKKSTLEIDNASNLLTDDIMTSGDGMGNKRWKELSIEEKLDKFNSYFQLSKYKDEEILSTKIEDLIKSNKIDYRKYIVYDKINQRIDDLPIIRYNSETKKYELLTDIEQKTGNKKCHKKKISKIIQIK
tara:strand:- start:1459 stop:2052 length:594 start_codon:yes stop_codon:yes gene_type:complete